MPADEGRSWPKSSPSDAVMDNSSQLSAKICLFPLLPVDKKMRPASGNHGIIDGTRGWHRLRGLGRPATPPK